MNCTKAIIPVAGYGTRRLPITKSLEKCMLPVLNRPVIDYVVEDCIKAGIEDIYFVISQGGGQQLKAYYEQNHRLEAYLRDHGKDGMIPSVTPPQEVRFHYVEQDADVQYGTTVPVWLCREYIGEDEQVLVLMGDDFIYNTDGSSESARLIEAASDGGSAMLGVSIPVEQVSRYGVIAMRDQDGTKVFDHIQEKPTPEQAESNLMNPSKYLFDAEFFRYLGDAMEAAPNAAGEYFITDPINAYVQADNRLVVIEAKGAYLDSGSAENWVHANNVVLESQQK
jgi:UTP--glucose-1-phosphate uridylyltransferase